MESSAATPIEARSLTLAPGLIYVSSYLDGPAQAGLLAEIEDVLAVAPWYRPRMPRSGHPFSVQMTNCGPLGWVSDERGYRYQSLHPATGHPWPTIPRRALQAWAELGNYPHPPEACLVNFYDADARLGQHRDHEEADFAAPVVSLSLGDSAIFRYGGTSRRDPTRRLKLDSGDAIVLGGPARLFFHGIDRILSGSSRLLPLGGRINLTLRRVTSSDSIAQIP
jgi:alkylated DNA repair protein (DNA oxidative demethylase)